MNLYTCYVYDKKLIHYYSKEENFFKMPEIWIHENDNKFYLCGASMFLNQYAPDRKGLKNSTTVFSILLNLQNILEKLTVKEKKKLCLLNLKGQEYKLNTIHLNKTYKKFIPVKKEIKNEKTEK